MSLIDRIRAPFGPAAGGPAAALIRTGPLAAAAVAILVLAGQLASLAWRLFADDESAPAAPPAITGPAAPAFDVASIVNAHLFGVTAADPNAAPEAAAGNFVLAGTLAGRDPEQGWAILGPNQQAARLYATGATLPGGARLIAVYADRVILERGGRRESLLLPRASGGARPLPVARAAPAAAPVPPLDNVRELLARNPGAGTEILRPQPVFTGGQLRGYRLYPGRNRQQFTSLGLQPGDLVTAINGAPLDDPNRGLEALQGLAIGGAATLTIDRNGQVQQVSVDASAVAPQTAPADNQVQMPSLDVAE